MSTNKKITRQRINNDPSFERTRENMAEFANAGKAVKIIRSAFRDLLLVAGDTTFNNRLQKTAARVVHSDPASDRGQRTVSRGDIRLFEGFNFNSRNGLGEALFTRHTINIDRVTGTVTVSIPEFVPRVRVQAPPGATNFKIIVAAVAVDFEKGAYQDAIGETASLPWDRQPISATTLSLQLPPGSNLPILVGTGVIFEQAVNSKNYPLNGGNFNAAALERVDLPLKPA